MKHYLPKIAAAALVAVALAVPAQAATVIFGATPEAAQENPLAIATTGTVFENVTGSVGGVRRSPWQGSTVNENATDAYYSSVSANSSATYNFTKDQTSVSFLWGSPDSYNDLDIILSGAAGTVVVNGMAAQGPVAILAQYVTIKGVGLFNSLTFRSKSNAFEYANLETSPVPIPAALPLLFAALGGLGFVGRRRRRAQT